MKRPFKKFDLNAVIENYNKTHKPQIPQNATFSFFNGLPNLNKHIDDVNGSERLSRFSSSELDVIRKKKESLGGRASALIEGTVFLDNRITPHHEDPNQRIDKKVAFYEWQDAQSIALNALIERVQQSELKRLKEQQQRIDTIERALSLAAHSHLSLLALVSNQLPALEQYLKATLKQKKPKGMPNPIFVAYTDYCKKLLVDCQSLRALVIDNMLLRLELMSQSQFQQSNVMAHCIQLLQKEGVIKEKQEFPIDENPMSAHLFFQYQECIQKEGTVLQKKRLYALPWYQENVGFKTKTIKRAGNSIIIPLELTNIVPSKMFWFLGNFPKLFPKNALKKHLILESQYLFARLKTSEITALNPNSLDLLSNCIQHLQILHSNSALIEKTLFTLNQTGVLKKDNAILAYRKFLTQKNDALRIKQLRLIEEFIQYIEGRNKTPKAKILDYKTCELLKALSLELQKYMKSISPDEALKARIHAAKKSLNAILRLNQNYFVMDKLVRGKEVSESDFTAFMETYKSYEMAGTSEANELKGLISPHLNQIFKNLLLELKVSFFTMPGIIGFQKHYEKLSHYKSVLLVFNHFVPESSMIQKLNKYVIRYFEFLMHIEKPTDAGMAIIQSMEKVFISIAKDHQILSEPLEVRLQELKATFCDESWLIGKAKLQAWVSLLKTETSQHSFEKEVAHLNANIFSYLRDNQKLDYNENHLKELDGLIESCVEKGTTDFSKLPVSHHQKILFQLNNEHSPVKDLILLATRARVKENQLRKEKTSEKLSVSFVKEKESLREALSHTLQKHSYHIDSPGLFRICQKKPGLCNPVIGMQRYRAP
ncbi:MAG: hypothetical protein JSS53_06520 [Proteobacteria bacterium]|nr:hypothetical protein [Pseudomonadota bacterium]